MDEEETQTLGNSISILGEIDTPVMDFVNRYFYNLVETGSSKLNAEGMDFLEPAILKVVDSVKACQILKNKGLLVYLKTGTDEFKETLFF